jgi:hypothetical protein
VVRWGSDLRGLDGSVGHVGVVHQVQLVQLAVVHDLHSGVVKMGWAFGREGLPEFAGVVGWCTAPQWVGMGTHPWGGGVVGGWGGQGWSGVVRGGRSGESPGRNQNRIDEEHDQHRDVPAVHGWSTAGRVGAHGGSARIAPHSTAQQPSPGWFHPLTLSDPCLCPCLDP